MALYSDILASRPPSPGRETPKPPVDPVVPPSDKIDSEGVFGSDQVDALNSDGEFESGNDTSSEDNRVPERPEGQFEPWTTVKHRRARSLDSGPIVQEVGGEKKTQTKVLTKEQTRTVQCCSPYVESSAE